jgi:hypothetical protein
MSVRCIYFIFPTLFYKIFWCSAPYMVRRKGTESSDIVETQLSLKCEVQSTDIFLVFRQFIHFRQGIIIKKHLSFQDFTGKQSSDFE